MNLYPLVLAVGIILIGAVLVALWPGMDADYKRLLYIVIAIAVVICIFAVFWPSIAGHMRVSLLMPALAKLRLG